MWRKTQGESIPSFKRTAFGVRLPSTLYGSMSALLDEASDIAFARLKSADNDILRLPTLLQTVAVIHSTQGIIDNGGLEYFFESDFDGTPEYSFFADADQRIGAESAASCIDTAAAMFPFSQPHLHEAKRQQWLGTVRDDDSHLFVKLSRKVCGDESVFAKLAEYVDANKDAFKSV